MQRLYRTSMAAFQSASQKGFDMAQITQGHDGPYQKETEHLAIWELGEVVSSCDSLIGFPSFMWAVIGTLPIIRP